MELIHCFAVNLRKYRKERGYSQEYLAELAGLHRTYVSALERERRNISIENIEKIANALHIDAFHIFSPTLQENFFLLPYQPNHNHIYMNSRHPCQETISF